MFVMCFRFGISNGGMGGGLFLSGCDWSPGFRVPFGIGVINAGFGSDGGGGGGGIMVSSSTSSWKSGWRSRSDGKDESALVLSLSVGLSMELVLLRISVSTAAVDRTVLVGWRM